MTIIEMSAAENSRGDSFEVGEWCMFGHVLAHIWAITTSMSGEVTVWRQYFKNGSCEGCLEGDDGTGGSPEYLYKIDKQPVMEVCDLCGEEAPVFKDG